MCYSSVTVLTRVLRPNERTSFRLTTRSSRRGIVWNSLPKSFTVSCCRIETNRQADSRTERPRGRTVCQIIPWWYGNQLVRCWLCSGWLFVQLLHWDHELKASDPLLLLRTRLHCFQFPSAPPAPSFSQWNIPAELANSPPVPVWLSWVELSLCVC